MLLLRKIFLSASFCALFLALVWYAPLGREEREFAKLRAEDRWQLCDYKREGDRLFVLRLYARFGPILRLLREREERRVKDVFQFQMRASGREINAPDTFYWDDLKASALDLSNAFSLRHWIFWENDVNELLEWDRARLTGSFLPRPKEFKFTPSDAVQRTGKYELTLLLHPGDFEAAREVFQRTIEKYWSQPPYRLRVVWSDTDPRAYKFVFEPFAGFNRVETERRKIFLRERITDGTLLHEVGHVLGFADHYEVYWSEKNCQLRGSAYLRDVMANSAFREPLLGHWLLLEKGYPLRRAPGHRREFSYRQSDVFLEDRRLVARANRPISP